MLVKALGLGAALALAADAILLPPDVALDSEPSDDRTNALLNAGVDPHHLAVKVNCAGCPYAKQVDNGRMVWTTGVESSLLYDFKITGANDRSLALNDVPIYPPPTFGRMPNPIYMQQVPSNDDLTKFIEEHPDRRGLMLDGYEVIVRPAETVDEAGNELLQLKIKVFSIAGQTVPRQALNVFMIKDAQGSLRIVKIDSLTADQIKEDEKQECAKWPMMCQWREYLKNKMDALRSKWHKLPSAKGCMKNPFRGGRKHGNQNHGPIVGGVDFRPHHMRPGPDGKLPPMRGHHHGHHEGHHRHHHSKVQRVLHAVARVLINIIVPILIGIAAGVATYLAGMIIGMTVALVWMKIRGRGDYARVALDEEEGFDSDDDVDTHKYLSEKEAEAFKDSIPVEVEGEAPPRYEEAAEKEVVGN